MAARDGGATIRVTARRAAGVGEAVGRAVRTSITLGFSFVDITLSVYGLVAIHLSGRGMENAQGGRIDPSGGPRAGFVVGRLST